MIPAVEAQPIHCKKKIKIKPLPDETGKGLYAKRTNGESPLGLACPLPGLKTALILNEMKGPLRRWALRPFIISFHSLSLL